MVLQYNNYLNSTELEYNKVWNSQNSLFCIWIGSNEIRSACGNNQVPETLYNNALDRLLQILEDIYNSGARNYLFLNIPPLETIPYYMRHVYPFVKNDVEYFNTHLDNTIQLFSEKHDDINIFVYDVHKRSLDVINHCKAYQFKDCKRAWLKTKKYPLRKYFYSDLSHNTYKANEIFVKDMLEMLNV